MLVTYCAESNLCLLKGTIFPVVWCARGLTVDAQYYRTSDRQEFEREISIEECSKQIVVRVANSEAFVSFL
jgi:hypothetical protein